MRRLLIFLKDPVPGKVKTRLASVIGAEAACEAYRRCAEATLERMQRLRQEAVLLVEPAEALGRIRQGVGDDWRLRPQQGRTLGERLMAAMAAAFAEGATGVVAIGTDSPWLTADEVETAFEALRHHDAVLGPTQDGGYYLIGLRRFVPALFEGIAWSTASVYAQTLARADHLRLHMHVLRTGYDVDRPADLQRWLKETKEEAHART